MTRAYTAAQREAVVAGIADGESMNSIHLDTGVSFRTIRKWCARAGVEPTLAHSCSTREERESVRDRMRNGESLASICRTSKRHRRTLSRWTADIPRKHWNPALPDERRRAVTRVLAGERPLDVAADLGRSHPAVCSWCREHARRQGWDRFPYR